MTVKKGKNLTKFSYISWSKTKILKSLHEFLENLLVFLFFIVDWIRIQARWWIRIQFIHFHTSKIIPTVTNWNFHMSYSKKLQFSFQQSLFMRKIFIVMYVEDLYFHGSNLYLYLEHKRYFTQNRNCCKKFKMTTFV